MGSKPMMFAGGSGVSAFRGKKSSAEAHHSVIQEQIKSEEKKEAVIFSIHFISFLQSFNNIFTILHS
jgi:hypothetical protein